MSFRRNRKFKEKPAVFAFGHIMLPLVAILAIGLLILGVRLLFVSPGGQVSYPDTVEYPEAESQAPTVIAEPGDGPQVVAVPSTGGDEPTATPGAVPAVPAAEEAPTTLPEAETKAEVPVQASRGSWVVQIGAFSLKESAETLAHEVRGKNFNAYVTRAEVGGKTYYRVRVPAGDQKAEADTLARDLASKGYPTLVTRQE
ncbi:MAG: SPOR domain-containing protein [Thermovirgaceae bacterium]|nr:SPOR domain-containing protein [Synergistales bacterium]HPC75101.1 SPOR domain-containing protein [Synergistales bacterium]HRS48427.1 SPOR domain-containing protein [Thermovirgaceae bacterium]HRU90343.1 SPOR domain-containing protein [Thermovirgaceae bacterium]